MSLVWVIFGTICISWKGENLKVHINAI
eukprot:SAG11_NODE_1988_length_3961_cov_2.373900_1_plen_27_part_10